MTDTSNEARSQEIKELHRVKNELYSATLALRAVVSLIDRGEVDRARAAAANILEKITASRRTDADITSAHDRADSDDGGK